MGKFIANCKIRNKRKNVHPTIHYVSRSVEGREGEVG